MTIGVDYPKSQGEAYIWLKKVMQLSTYFINMMRQE